MPRVIVTTDDGRPVWSMPILSYALTSLTCPTNTSGSALASGIRRAVEDAEKIERGEDPERPSEKAMRLADEERARQS